MGANDEIINEHLAGYPPGGMAEARALLAKIHEAADVARAAIGDAVVSRAELNARLTVIATDLRPKQFLVTLDTIELESRARIPALFLRESELPPPGTRAEIRGGSDAARRDFMARAFSRIRGLGIREITWREDAASKPELVLILPDGTERSLGYIDVRDLAAGIDAGE